MKKVILVILLLILLPLVLAYTDTAKVQINNRIPGVKHDCELGQNTCFGRFYQECQRDSLNNVMWNTVDSCGVYEFCDDEQGCIKTEFNTPRPEKISFKDQKPDWADCVDKESKCSDDLTKIVGCKNGKWIVKQVCSEEAICMNQFGCIKKEEVKKEVSLENYDRLISLQTKNVDVNIEKTEVVPKKYEYDQKGRILEKNTRMANTERPEKKSNEIITNDYDDLGEITVKEQPAIVNVQIEEKKELNKLTGLIIKKEAKTVGFIDYILSWFFRS